MKKLLIKTCIIAMLMIIFTQLSAFATIGKITLTTSTDKDSYNEGDKITVTVSWGQEMEAAGFTLKYDKDKLKFSSTTENSNFYNSSTPGEIVYNWAAISENAKKSVSFIFEARETGEAIITTSNASGFANSDLEEPTGYVYSSKKITVKKEETTNTTTKTTTNTKITTNTTNTTNKTSDKTTAKGKMPQTGAEQTTLIVLLTFAIVGIVVYVKYKNLSDI